jgi:CheY-like chemotaxis protein
MTGHLVLSTLHTNDAATAIPRLLNLGVDRTVLADSLAAIVAQRLCRKLCEQCKQPVADPLSPVENRYLQLTHNRPLYRSVGCKACNYSGFKGRLPIVDIIEMNAGLRQAVASGETRLDVLESLRRGGLKSLAASGSHRIMSGESTVGEVLEAVGPSFWRELALHHGTELSDDDSDGAHEPLEAGHAVLLISDHPDEAASGMADAVKEAGLRLHTCANAKAAEQLLHDDERIAVIVGDLPDAASLPQAAALLQEFRTHVAWSRLPALVLLPEALAGHQQHLPESGSMAEFLTKPVKDEDLMRAIQRAHAR